MRITKDNVKDFEFSFETLDKLYNEDVESQLNALKALGVTLKKDGDIFNAETITKTKSYEYIVNRIFPLRIEGYVLIENGELDLKNSKTFHEKYETKIKEKNKFLVSKAIKDTKGLYTISLYRENFLVDTEKMQINQAKHSPFTYNVASV